MTVGAATKPRSHAATKGVGACASARPHAESASGSVVVLPAINGTECNRLITFPRSPIATFPRRRPAFTLTEVLIVIVVISILIGAISVVGVKALRSHKVKLTETIMNNVKLAIDQFANQNPLASIYDRPNARTFGPYPPYQLKCSGPYPVPYTVAGVLEPYDLYDPDQNHSYVLADRLHRDLGNRYGNVADWVKIDELTQAKRKDDDIRALYVYLKLRAPQALSQVPPTAIKPLDPGFPEYVNPTGAGTAPGTNGLIDVLGIHDAWGVPLDYFLYVKLEFGALPGAAGTGWYIADRRPVLRSRGISREEYDAGVDDPQRWIFSDPFPAPAAKVRNSDGLLTGTGRGCDGCGWARAVALGETYTYVDTSSP